MSFPSNKRAPPAAERLLQSKETTNTNPLERNGLPQVTDFGHLLFHCPKIWSLWTIKLTALNVQWVPLWMVRDFTSYWIKIPARKAEMCLKAALCFLMWAIWQERNRTVFKDEKLSVNRLKRFFCTFHVVLG